MACQVYKCRFPDTHITSYHKCGECGDTGHGRYECSRNNKGSYDLENKLFFRPMVQLKKENYCTIQNCFTPSTHSASAHQKSFGKYDTIEGPDIYGIGKTAAEGKEHIIKLISGKKGTCARIYWGFAHFICARNNNGNIEVNAFSDGSEEDLRQFFKGYIEITERPRSAVQMVYKNLLI